MIPETISIILAGGVGSRLHPLTSDRAKPAVPFGGRYRIIDFVLSNCLHSGLRQIMVLTQYKSHSLFKHLRDGWSVFNPSIGEYLTVIPPQMRTGSSWYSGTADAVYQNLYLLKRSGARYVLVLSGDHIYRMDYAAMLDFHRATDAQATVACMRVPLEQAASFGVMSLDDSHQITKFVEKPPRPESMSCGGGQALASMGIYVFDLNVLCDALETDAQSDHSSHDFGKNILPKMIVDGRVMGYEFGSQQGRVSVDGYWRDVGTLDSYYQANMDLLLDQPKMDLYQQGWPIYGNVNQAPPARVGPAQHTPGTCDNVMMAPGTVVSGATVSDSILSSRVSVDVRAKVMNSVLFDDVVVGAGASLNKCIIDKDVVIPPGTRIGFDHYSDSKRFVVSDGGVTIVPRGYSFTCDEQPSKPARSFDPPIRVRGKDASSVLTE